MKTTITIIAALAWAGAATAQTAKPEVPVAPPEASSPAAEATAPTETSNWRVTATPSALDPANSRGTAMIESTNNGTSIAGYPRKATLIVRCQGRERAFYINWPDYLGIDAPMVTWKLDQGAVQRGYWPESSDGSAAGFWRGREAESMIAQIRQSTRLIVSMDNRRRVPQEITFDLTGADAAITEAFAACSG